jgi:hypothetical protein
MKEPQVTFKNVKTFRGMEGYGLNADIYINGVKSIFVMDEANGGEYNYEYYNKEQAQLLLDYIASLPEYPMIIGGKPYIDKNGKPAMMKPSLDQYICDKMVELEDKKAEQKFEKQKAKLQETAILFGVPEAKEYRYLNFRKPLSQVDKMTLQREYTRVKMTWCKNGVEVLNTNLRGLIVLPVD